MYLLLLPHPLYSVPAAQPHEVEVFFNAVVLIKK